MIRVYFMEKDLQKEDYESMNASFCRAEAIVANESKYPSKRGFKN